MLKNKVATAVLCLFLVTGCSLNSKNEKKTVQIPESSLVDTDIPTWTKGGSVRALAIWAKELEKSAYQCNVDKRTIRKWAIETQLLDEAPPKLVNTPPESDPVPKKSFLIFSDKIHLFNKSTK